MDVALPHDASCLSPNLSVLCGTSDRNSKRDVCFGARNLILLSLGVLIKSGKGALVPLAVSLALFPLSYPSAFLLPKIEKAFKFGV